MLLNLIANADLNNLVVFIDKNTQQETGIGQTIYYAGSNKEVLSNIHILDKNWTISLMINIQREKRTGRFNSLANKQETA